MQPIISGEFVQELDKKFVQAQGLTSYQLMERAAQGFCQWFLGKFDSQKPVHIICGVGNNGGDGLAIARILHQAGRRVSVFYFDNPDKKSEDYSYNFAILSEKISKVSIQASTEFHFQDEIIIDGLFGVGLNRPLSGLYENVVQKINSSNNTVIAIDIPSGLASDDLLEGIAVQAAYTVSFQFPKLSLLFPEHTTYVGELIVVDIGIGIHFFESYSTPYLWLRSFDIPKLHKTFHRFSHKGDFGKVLLLGGSEGKMGSIVLSSLAALRTGSGLVSACIPKCGIPILQSCVPEAMVQVNEGEKILELPVQIDDFDALGIGPGLGITPQGVDLLTYIIESSSKGLVIDADAINILAKYPQLFRSLSHCVLTPHLKEFERLVGPCDNHLDRLRKAREFTMQHQCVLVLKGANTVVSLPDGRQVFNSTGNQYMATGGSGDALTGIITSFLGQGYSLEQAALCGVFHHGLAGELASKERLRGTIASDIINKVPETFTIMGIV
ncbi:MAG TPA: NAD(P)H-hydrate dehydratase [Lunatimonas sp.]|nr:NAD(P)H-hydrate dehydratase [Lunatimonas sp.]